MDALNLGSGLVEISAVATLVGASVAEKLALGEKAAAGFPWASMSAFGIMHVIKVCLSACMPDWTREALGLRNDGVDAAIGLCALVENRRHERRADLGDACAIRMPYSDAQPEHQMLPLRTATPAQGLEPKTTVFYALDRTATFILNTISKSRSGMTLVIHEYVPDIQGASSRFRDCVDGEIPQFKDNIVLFASTAKGLEIGVLCGLGAQTLWWATALGWVVALLGSVLIQSFGVSRDHLSRPRTDLLAGTLPSHAMEGSQCTILLGIPDNVRRHTIWRIVWALTAIANLASLLVVFLCLGRQTPRVVYTWLCFQGVWLLTRSIVYRVLEGASACQGIVRATSWDDATISSRQRAVRLLLGLSRQQITLHPRGVRAYLYDSMSELSIVSLFESAKWTLTDFIELPHSSRRSDGVEERATILGVIGDPVLRSVVWAHSAGLSNPELYDCALVFLRIEGMTYSTPSVHVCSCNCNRNGGKGNRHPDSCTLIEWVTFVPCRSGWWHLHSTRATGYMPAEHVADVDLHDRLNLAKEWNIGLRSIEEVRSILKVSRTAARLLRDMVRGTRV